MTVEICKTTESNNGRVIRHTTPEDVTMISFDHGCSYSYRNKDNTLANGSIRYCPYCGTRL